MIFLLFRKLLLKIAHLWVKNLENNVHSIKKKTFTVKMNKMAEPILWKFYKQGLQNTNMFVVHVKRIDRLFAE